MTRGTLIYAVIAAVGFVATDRALATEPQITHLQAISSPATARFVPLGIHKSLLIETPRDIKDVLVADPGIVTAIVETKRRVYIIGGAVGQTDVDFIDADGAQIDALNITVTKAPQPAPVWGNSALPAKVLTLVHGDQITVFSCSPTTCIAPEEAESSNTTHEVITTHNR